MTRKTSLKKKKTDEVHVVVSDDIMDEPIHKVRFEQATYTVEMETSVQEFGAHVYTCNNDFRENVMRKVQTIKLKDTSELNMQVE